MVFKQSTALTDASWIVHYVRNILYLIPITHQTMITPNPLFPLSNHPPRPTKHENNQDRRQDARARFISSRYLLHWDRFATDG